MRYLIKDKQGDILEYISEGEANDLGEAVAIAKAKYPGQVSVVQEAPQKEINERVGREG